MGRFGASWQIVKASWAVLRRDRSLVWLPVISMVASLVTAGTFVGAIVVTRSTDPLTGRDAMTLASYLLMFGLYLAMAVVTLFFNAALVAGANQRMEGGDPTLSSALAGAGSRFRLIAGWALFSATVSMILNQIRERMGLLGRLAAGAAGLAWTLVTFLVLPVIVVEGLSVRDALRRSRFLFSRTWGEQVVGNVAIGGIGLAALVAGAVVTVPLIATRVAPLVVLGIVALVAWALATVAVTSAMSGIFRTALYRYAATGQLPAGFEGGQLDAAFRPRAVSPTRRLLG